MSLVRPGALWLLVLAVPLVLLHLRMRRRVRVVVPSLLAWDPSAAGGAPPRVAGVRPRDLLGLLLELSALACLAVFAAGPVRGEAAAPARPLALVLDGSASTRAAGRFEEMRELARRALEAAGPEAPVSVWLAAGEVRVLAAPGEPRERAAAALAAARPRVAGGGSLGAAAAAALGNGGEVVVFTDGCDPEAAALAARGDLRVVSVGREERNRGLVALAVDRERGREAALWLRVRGADGEAGEERREAGGGGGGGWAVDLRERGGEDALRDDDGIPSFGGSLTLPPLRVAVVAPGGTADPYLAAALEAAGDLVDRGRSVVVAPEGWDGLAAAPDVAVVRGKGRGRGGAGAGVPRLVLDGGEGAAAEAPAVQAGATDHPVMRGVDPAEWIVTRGRALASVAGDAVLLLGPGGPLAVAGEREGRRAVILGFDPAASTLPLSGSFPVFLRNALAWLAGGREEAVLVVPAGGRAEVPVGGGRARVAVRGPMRAGEEGTSVPSFEVEAGNGIASFRVPWPEDPEACLLEVEDGVGGRTVLVTALLDGEESDLAPRIPRNADAYAPVSRSGPADGRRSLAANFGLAAALLLVLESLLWGMAGRKAGTFLRN